ncbi:MAG TPA: ribose 5-phosphate isomerase A [Puia sp.]|jgi:ribose 5-phosphate isomerase A
MPDYKKDAAKEALKLIRPNSTIGFGGGGTLAHLIGFIKEDAALAASLKTISSSFITRRLLRQLGFAVQEMETTSRVDLYFDGCDQFDWRLSALKSGGGIHTSEKVLAAMADEFIIVGDSSKKVDKLDGVYPVVVEVIPEALAYVSDRVKKFFGPMRSELRLSDKKDGAVITERGNFLIDNWFSPFPEPALLNERLISISGILEHSLFFNMAHKAVIAGPGGIEICRKP